MSLPPLKSLPVFEAVARLNSFSHAAAELRITQSAVSHHIKALEDHLGESLFVRSGRKLELTLEGQQYLDTITSSLNQIARATDLIKGASETRLRLTVYSSFAVYWLIPRMPELKRRFPNLELTLEMSYAEPELSDRVADCFITIDKEKRGFHFDLLYKERLFPVCSTAYLEEIKHTLHVHDDQELHAHLAASPQSLANFPLLTSFSMYEKYTEEWRRWFASMGTNLPPNAQFHRFSHLMLAYEGAKHGLGVALINDYMLQSNSDDGLVRLPCSHYATEDHFYFAYKHSRRHEPAIAQLKQWIQQESSSLRV
ncbi:LysR family transcriptional regulator [Maribrevibacterium harenarium]|uniref:LysR family transcriptional regulator n=2 Tax=Maribrevibacterium harenarium TaxID=2589817 RepID=A0A501X2A2_9GAMM|nr:LysR family transcriptional regulator [Maribrevibacterium harenarium]